MTTLTEAVHAGEFIVSEANNSRSREQITVQSGADLVAGQVLGATETSTATIAVAAAVSASGGTVGNGSIGTPTADAGALPGVYRVEIVNPNTNLGNLRVLRPDGSVDGVGVVGTAYNGMINFTLADGTNDWVEDDYILVTVSYPSAALKYAKLDPAAVNGLQYAAGILYAAAAAASADVRGVGLVRSCEVNADIITWPAGISAANKATAINQLKALGIILR